LDPALISAWRRRVEQAAMRLGWSASPTVARPHAGGVQLALAARPDQLFVATEINEWALCASLLEHDAPRWHDLQSALREAALENAGNDNPASALPPILDEAAALERFDRIASLEAQPRLIRLLNAAESRHLPALIDEDTLTLGAGAHSHDFAMACLPDDADVCWKDLGDIPTAVVTGSNGKTTTVRLIAACARAAGWHTGYNCTEGVFLDDERLATGDYAGPAGARMVLRERRAQAAILETARGGILRRGIAMSQASVALVTNVSADHFGEYGVDDLNDLVTVKLTIAATVRRHGLLILNAADSRLRAQAEQLPDRLGSTPRLGWFSATPEDPLLSDYLAGGAWTCGVSHGRLQLKQLAVMHDLGEVVSMPLAIGGIATYNIENLAGAALAAFGLGIAPLTIRATFARFGADPNDNPGRLMHFERAGVTILVDYAHNPDGLRGFLQVANQLRRSGGRLCLILGQAGNRADADVEELVAVAAGFNPDLVVVKENETQLRGRALGEMPALIHARLMALGFPDPAVPVKFTEVDAAHHALAWAAPGDVVALPLHGATARAAIIAELSSEVELP
jgi:cyanophycin synthetase